MMLTGPKRPFPAKRAAPVGPDHRGQLARLIRERPVFVNVARRRFRGPSKRRNLPEYVNVSGVFVCEDGGSPRAELNANLVAEPADIGDP